MKIIDSINEWDDLQAYAHPIQRDKCGWKPIYTYPLLQQEEILAADDVWNPNGGNEPTFK